MLLPNPPVVIIISAHSEQAIDSFDLDVADFLRKPFEYPRFVRALSRALKRIALPPAAAPAEPPKNVVPEKQEIYIKSGRRLERFKYDDILYIEAYGLYSKIHTPDGVFAISKRISTLPYDLPENRFVRIHKSFIINVTHLKRVELKQVWVKGTKLPIGITYRPVVQGQLNQLGILLKSEPATAAAKVKA